MRFVAVADTHQAHDKLVVPDGDVFVHAGDMSHRGTLAELEEVRDWMAKLPHTHKVLVAGNHDFGFERFPTQARALFADVVTYLEGDTVDIGGLKIWGGPWQPWFHSWAFNVKRGEPIDKIWQRIPHGLDLLITHGPPYGFGDKTWLGERVGCKDLLRHVQEKKPRAHVFGHIHEEPGVWQLDRTQVMNVTVAECTLPATVFDL
jgi:Icc-related predicted phosphoesterase